MLQARQIMSRDVLTLSSGRSLQEAFHLMRSCDVRHLPIVDGDTLVGILSWSDILLHAHDGGATWADGGATWADDCGGATYDIELVVPDRPIAAVMSRHVITCFPSSDIADVAATMVACKIASLPVVEDERVVGLLTASDLLDILCRLEDSRRVQMKPVEPSARAEA
jgi:acetoin utilization protein AcuB